MMWVRDHEPMVWHRATTLEPVGSYVLHHLTGSHAQDAANASSTSRLSTASSIAWL